ncbi:hypothetical protein EVAR_20716_1 [Eumeta japonica]|uniref:Endonuclease/exonuclease/phosphatase domain-containing protein n=1 Tax=Eumeta variegata TaxID=151549 RepID=A0A4C1V9D4_EUMVA|nr:hypothetical protein EVAR_20716_1 [Eumeta japonica]
MVEEALNLASMCELKQCFNYVKCSHFRVPGFVCLRDDTSGGYGGVVVPIRNHNPFSPFGTPAHGNGLQAVAVKVEGTTFLSLDIASSSLLILSELEVILSTLVKPCFALGNFNCHHTLSDCGDVDSAGETLVDIMDKLDLCNSEQWGPNASC